MYNQYDQEILLDSMSINNRLFATFSIQENIEDTLNTIQKKYSILYNKIFVLEIDGGNEYLITYNIDQQNINSILENTILVHRKKQTNSLYTVNALNEVIKKENNGVLDKKYSINWDKYRNCLLLTKHNELRQLTTNLYDIISL